MPERNEPLASVVALSDFESLAREKMDAGAFDYIAGGSWDEISLHDNVAAWQRRRLRPRVLVDVSRVDPSTTLLGRPVALPLAIAPMAVHGLAHHDGELATARAAGVAGVPYIHSTSSSRSIEEVATAAPETTRWFQLYVQEDAAITRSLVERAAAAGYGAIVLTVDLPVLGSRERDRRTGYALPPFGNFEQVSATHGSRGVAAGAESTPDRIAALTWADLATIRSWSGLPLVLKGILTAEDARLAVESGVDAIVVSNHGARQLDRVPAPIDVLAEVVAAVGNGTEVWVDGGVRRGLDLAIAMALGARGVLLGRPVLWALAVGGQAGVERAIAIVREEFELTLRLLGTPTPADITRDHVAD
ncbi:MAG: alpha-hydroxy acid oxidase [Chloroflexota bacterium]